MGKKYKIYTSKVTAKFFICIVLVIIIPAYFISYLVKNNFENYIYKEISNNVIKTSLSSKTDIEQIATSMFNLSSVFIRDSKLTQILSEQNAETFEINKTFDNLCQNVSNLSLMSLNNVEITLADKQNNIYSSWTNNSTFIKDEKVVEWIEDSKNVHGKIVWRAFTPSFVYEEKNSGESFISLARALYCKDDFQEYIGTIIISIRQSYLETILKKYCYTNDLIYICDNNGNQVMSIDDDNIINDETLKDAYLLMQDKKSGFATIKTNGMTYIVNDYLLPSGWKVNDNICKVLRFTRNENITKQFSDFTKTINILLFVSILVVLAIAFLFISKLLEPISKLSSKMKKYTIEQKVTELDIKRNDEIGDLNRSFIQMSDYIMNLVDEIQSESDFKEKYQYEALVAQLNPHFLFNTLNTIRWMALIRKADNIVKCIDSLGNLLKYSMNKEGEIVTLQDEVTQLISYIDIQNYRYGDNFKLNINIPDEIMEYKVVKFILQPIVENCIKHAFKEKNKSFKIMLSAHFEDNCLKLYVEDNGGGISKEILDMINNQNDQDNSPNSITGIGISHVNRRLKILYGNSFGIMVDSVKLEKTTVIFTLPIIKGDTNNEKDINC